MTPEELAKMARYGQLRSGRLPSWSSAAQAKVAPNIKEMRADLIEEGYALETVANLTDEDIRQAWHSYFGPAGKPVPVPANARQQLGQLKPMLGPQQKQSTVKIGKSTTAKQTPIAKPAPSGATPIARAPASGAEDMSLPAPDETEPVQMPQSDGPRDPGAMISKKRRRIAKAPKMGLMERLGRAAIGSVGESVAHHASFLGRPLSRELGKIAREGANQFVFGDKRRSRGGRLGGMANVLGGAASGMEEMLGNPSGSTGDSTAQLREAVIRLTEAVEELTEEMKKKEAPAGLNQQTGEFRPSLGQAAPVARPAPSGGESTQGSSSADMMKGLADVVARVAAAFA